MCVCVHVAGIKHIIDIQEIFTHLLGCGGGHGFVWRRVVEGLVCGCVCACVCVCECVSVSVSV